MTLKTLRAKKCLITGATSGIGRATTHAAAAEGAYLVLTDLRADALETLSEEARRLGGKVLLTRALDLRDFEAVSRFGDDVRAEHGSMDAVMNIAGIAIWGTVDKLKHEHWKSVIDTNLMGPVHIIETFIPPMIAAGRGGHLVNVSSAAGLLGLPWHAAYSASKFGVRGISEVLRFDLARYDIGVSVVCPGAVLTPIVSAVKVVGADETRSDFQALKARFLRHAIPPEKVARAILRAIRRNQYMVYTSADIAIGHWFERVFPLPYKMAMTVLNDRFHAISQPRPNADASAEARR